MEVNTLHHLTPGDGQTSNLSILEKIKQLTIYLINKSGCYLIRATFYDFTLTARYFIQAPERFANPLCYVKMQLNHKGQPMEQKLKTTNAKAFPKQDSIT